MISLQECLTSLCIRKEGLSESPNVVGIKGLTTPRGKEHKSVANGACSGLDTNIIEIVNCAHPGFLKAEITRMHVAMNDRSRQLVINPSIQMLANIIELLRKQVEFPAIIGFRG